MTSPGHRASIRQLDVRRTSPAGAVLRSGGFTLHLQNPPRLSKLPHHTALKIHTGWRSPTTPGRQRFAPDAAGPGGASDSRTDLEANRAAGMTVMAGTMTPFNSQPDHGQSRGSPFVIQAGHQLPWPCCTRSRASPPWEPLTDGGRHYGSTRPWSQSSRRLGRHQALTVDNGSGDDRSAATSRPRNRGNSALVERRRGARSALPARALLVHRGRASRRLSLQLPRRPARRGDLVSLVSRAVSVPRSPAEYSLDADAAVGGSSSLSRPGFRWTKVSRAPKFPMSAA